MQLAQLQSQIYQIQKRVIIIITNSRMIDSCRELFQRLEILPLYSQYITPILTIYYPYTHNILPLYSQYIFSLFVIKNKHLYNTNNQIHSVHTRFKTNLHPPVANLANFRKGVYYSGIKIFNNLPRDIKDLANVITLFWNALKSVLLINSFYNSEEYFNYQR